MSDGEFESKVLSRLYACETGLFEIRKLLDADTAKDAEITRLRRWVSQDEGVGRSHRKEMTSFSPDA